MNPTSKEHQLVEDHSWLTILWVTGKWSSFERSATHWSPLKRMSMIGTWTHVWEINSCLMTPPASGHLPTDCGRHLANPLPWHCLEHPAWTSTCMGKGNTVAFMRNTCALLWQLGKHLVSQCQQIAYSWGPGRNLWNLIQAKHDQSSLNKIQKCLTAVGMFC